VNSILPDATAAWEVFYPPFQAAVDAGVAAVMCSYNYVNGTHSCGNEQLLKSDLKETMEFKGFVMSDWWATHSTAAEEGMDMEMPGNFDGNLLEPYYSPSNLASYGNATIDGMVTRVLTPMVEVGLIGGSDVKPRCTPGVDCDSMLYEVIATNKSHRDLALRVATESVLLLQNENSTLPLRAALDGPATFTIAVVGSACNASNDVEAMLPTFDVGNYYTIGGSGRVIPGSVVTVVNGLRRQTASKTSATVTLVESLTDDVPSALAALQSADYAVVCGGGTTAEMSDRPNLLLDQNDFIVAVANAASVPVVVVMLCPGPVLTPFKGDVAAIVALFLGGASTGDAVAAVLFGDHNPHAKSPVTFPLDEADTVAPCEPPNYYWSGFDCPYTEGLLVGYKAFDAFEKNVSFPFGHGLSFTAFKYSWAQAPALLPDGGVGFTVSLANAGAINGSEVLQVYTTFPLESNVPATTKALKAFRKVHVGAGLSENITIELGPSSFQRWDNTAWSFVGSPDRYTLYIGSSSRDIRLSAEVDIYL
jgi:beta-glucosidase